MKETMRRRGAAPRELLLCLIVVFGSVPVAFCQEGIKPATAQQTAAQPAAAQPAATKPAAVSPSYQAATQLYQRGRQLQMGGKQADAEKAFSSSLGMVEALLLSDASNADLISLECWNLFRLNRHKDVVVIAQKALLTVKDFRVMETLAESFYFLDRNEEALKQFAKYVELAPPGEERMSSAYYYIGECYMRLKKYEHADIAFSTATSIEKNMYYWWYRLGSAKELLGQYKRAYEIYGKALELNAGFQFAKDGRERVKAKAGL